MRKTSTSGRAELFQFSKKRGFAPRRHSISKKITEHSMQGMCSRVNSLPLLRTAWATQPKCCKLQVRGNPIPTSSQQICPGSQDREEANNPDS